MNLAISANWIILNKNRILPLLRASSSSVCFKSSLLNNNSVRKQDFYLHASVDLTAVLQCKTVFSAVLLRL